MAAMYPPMAGVWGTRDSGGVGRLCRVAAEEQGRRALHTQCHAQLCDSVVVGVAGGVVWHLAAAACRSALRTRPGQRWRRCQPRRIVGLWRLCVKRLPGLLLWTTTALPSPQYPSLSTPTPPPHPPSQAATRRCRGSARPSTHRQCRQPSCCCTSPAAIWSSWMSCPSPTRWWWFPCRRARRSTGSR